MSSVLESIITPLYFKECSSKPINSRLPSFHTFLHNVLQYLLDSPTQAIKPHCAPQHQKAVFPLFIFSEKHASVLRCFIMELTSFSWSNAEVYEVCL